MRFPPRSAALVASLSLLAAAAQAATPDNTTVTLYTLVDLNATHYSAGSLAGVGSGYTSVNDGTTNGLNGSRWGLKAARDLDYGLKAGVLLEAGVNVDTGNAGQGGRIFGRQGYLWLNSPTWGEIRVGRQYILEDSTMALTNSFGNALVHNPGTSVTNKGKNLPMWLNAPRADNVVMVQTPTVNGFYAAAQVAPGETTVDRFQGLKFAYSAGALNTALSYEWNTSRTTGKNINKSLTLGANYDFGAFKLLGGYQGDRDLVTGSTNGAAGSVSNLLVQGATSFTATKLTGFNVGVEVPFGSTIGVVNYTPVKYASATGTEATLGKLAVDARFTLGKETYAYTGVSFATGDLKAYITQKTVTQVGLRTAF